MLSENAYPALVLNADFRPLSTAPPSKFTWQEAIRAVLNDSVTVVSQYDRVIRSERMVIRLPSVIALRRYVDVSKPAPLTRWGLFLRDRLRCQYCAECFPTSELTFEHIVPRSRGGGSTWLNLATACTDCNRIKRDRTPAEAGMPLINQPWHPTLADLNAIGASMPPPKGIVEEWRSYVYWTTALEP